MWRKLLDMKPEHSTNSRRTGSKHTDSRHKVVNPKAAELLTDWRQRRFFEPFVPGPTTITEAAEVLGVKLNAMHYRVTQLLNLGLLEVVGATKRGGRAVKLYRPTAEAFFVPFAATPHATMVEMIRRLSALDEFLGHAVATLTAQSESWGVLVSAGTSEESGLEVKLTPLDAQGAPAPRPSGALLASSAPAVWSGETCVMLDFETAKALQRELADLSRRFEGMQSASGQPYYVVLGMTPMAGDRFELKSDS